MSKKTGKQETNKFLTQEARTSRQNSPGKISDKGIHRCIESEELFRKVFEEGPLGMALVGPDYRCMRANAALCRMLGYTEKELAKLTLRYGPKTHLILCWINRDYYIIRYPP